MEQIKLLQGTVGAKKILIFVAATLLMVSTVAAAWPSVQDPVIQEKRVVEKAQAEMNAKIDREREEVFMNMTPEEREARRKIEIKFHARRQVALAKMAKITMEQAIQIASSQKSGTAIECGLIGERGTAFYRVTVVSGDENDPTSSLVFVNAIDGTIGDFPNARLALITRDGKGGVITLDKPTDKP